MGLAENILDEHKNKITSLNLIPSTGGVFEVKLDETLLFSKKESDRFPEENEVENLVKARL